MRVHPTFAAMAMCLAALVGYLSSPTDVQAEPLSHGLDAPFAEPKFLSLDPAPQAIADPAPPSGSSSADDLSSKATDPTASLMAFNFTTTYFGEFHGDTSPGRAWEVKFQPVIPYKAFDLPNILRITMPYQLSGPGDDDLSDITIFNLTVFNQSWGRFGVGPVMSIPVSGDNEFAIGPAVGGVWRVNKKLNIGLFNQNLFGNDVAISQLQPIIAYQLGDGWALSLGDLQFIYDWEDQRWLNVPIGFQIGKVTELFGQHWRFSVNPQYNLKDDDGLPQWQVGITVTLLVPSGG
jgi:hypothetical protein